VVAGNDKASRDSARRRSYFLLVKGALALTSSEQHAAATTRHRLLQLAVKGIQAAVGDANVNSAGSGLAVGWPGYCVPPRTARERCGVRPNSSAGERQPLFHLTRMM